MSWSGRWLRAPRPRVTKLNAQRRERRERVVSRLDEQHPRVARIDRAEVAPQLLAGRRGGLAGHLDQGRPGTDPDERQPGTAACLVVSPASKAARSRARTATALSSDLTSEAPSRHSSWPK
jgi:hypothetical protein